MSLITTFSILYRIELAVTAVSFAALQIDLFTFSILYRIELAVT